MVTIQRNLTSLTNNSSVTYSVAPAEHTSELLHECNHKRQTVKTCDIMFIIIPCVHWNSCRGHSVAQCQGLHSSEKYVKHGS